MKKITSVLLLTLFCLSICVNATMIPHIGKPVGKPLPNYKLDLNLPANERWVDIAKDFFIPLQQFLALFNWLLPSSLDPYFDMLAVWSETLFQYPEMIQELKGVAKGAHLPFGKLVFINFMYEFSTIHKTYKACTSVVMRNSTGQILHGRNLDFFLWNRIAPMLARVDYYRGDQYVTTIDSIVGSTFALNGFSPKKFAITVDSRYLKPGEATFADVITNIFVNNYMPSAWNVRETLVNEQSFDAAKSRLENQNVTAPIYYIISGNSGNEGAVIEKKSIGTHGVYQLNETQWFLVQTNYDRDEQDPWYDNRRLPVEKKISDMGQNITAQDVFDKIMTQWPTFNIASLLTVITVPSQSFFNSTNWYSPY